MSLSNVIYRIIDTMSAVNVIIHIFILNGRTCNIISTFCKPKMHLIKQYMYSL